MAYAGNGHRALERAALRIAAFAVYPPRGTPHGLHQIEHPDFSRPLPFEFRNLPVYGFKITASMVDLSKPTPAGPSPHPAGGYPNMCALSSAGSTVAVDPDRLVDGIDIVLYDRGGAADPCRAGGP